MIEYGFNVNPLVLLFIGLVFGYIIRLIISDKYSKNKRENYGDSIIDVYYNDLKKRSVKELTAREYQHLTMLKKIEFEKKYPQKASSKIAMPLSKVFTIHTFFPQLYARSKANTKGRYFIVLFLMILFFTGILMINFKRGF